MSSGSVSTSTSGSTSSSGSSESQREFFEETPIPSPAAVVRRPPRFFSEISLCEFAFGVGSLGVNCLCFGMMLNIPTLTLHQIMYSVAPKGLIHKDATDQERVGVCKAILSYWVNQYPKMSEKDKFKQLYRVFVSLKQKELANEIKAKYEADESVTMEMFYKFDMARLGPYVEPVVEVEPSKDSEEIEGSLGDMDDDTGGSFDEVST